MKRRVLLKKSLAAGALLTTDLLISGHVLAAYPQAAFDSEEVADALSGAYGSTDYSITDAVRIKAPEIAENGAVVPVQVTSNIPDTESISIIVSKNPTPMAAAFHLHGAEAFVSTRLKMSQTSDLLAVVKADGLLYVAKQEVKVTIGGCGG